MGKVRKRAANTASLTLTTRQVRTVAENVAKKLKQHDDDRRTVEQDAAQNLFTVFMQRFDKVDQDNTDIKKSIADHIAVDNTVHKVVEQHKTYWGIAIKAALSFIAGGFALFLAWLNLR